MPSPKPEKNNIAGREREKTRLLEVLKNVSQNKGGTVFLIGEAGIGKTRLAEELFSDCELKVLRGKAVQQATPPYGPIVAILREYLQRNPDEQFGGPLAKYLRPLLPELGTSPKKVDATMLVEAIGSAIATIAQEQPLILFLDDLHWADNATLELLPFLTNRIQNEPVTIIAAYRSDEIAREHRIRWTRNELRRNRQLQEISLLPLTIEHCETLIKQMLGQPPAQSLTKIIYEKTQGLPLFVEELTSAMAANGLLQRSATSIEMVPGNRVPIPESVRDALLLRIDTLSDKAHNLLSTAAVIGVDFDLDLLVDIAGHEEGLEELFKRNLIVESSPHRGSFRHALTREAIRDEIGWSRRRALNRNIATYMESKGGPSELIADYWLAAKEYEKARQALLAAAEKSCRLHAYRDASIAASKALEIWPDGKEEEQRLNTLEQMAHCAQISGQLKDAVKAWREVLESPLTQTNFVRLGGAWRALAMVSALQGAWEQCLSARLEAAAAFKKSNKPAEAAIEWLAAANRQTASLHYNTAITYCDKSILLAKEAGHVDIQSRALGLKGNLQSMAGQHERGIKTVKTALSMALKHNLTEAASEIYRRMGSTLEYASDYTGSRKVYHTAIEYCQTHGVDSQANLCLSCMSYVLFRTGEWKRCIEICNDVMNNEKIEAGPKQLASCFIGLIRAHRGENRQSRKLLQDALGFFRKTESAAAELVCSWGLAIIAEQDDEPKSAEAHYFHLLDLREKTQDTHDTLPALCSATTYFAGKNLNKEATLCAEALSAIASTTGNTEALAALAYALGEIALLQNSVQEALEQFQQAQELFGKVAVPVEQAKTELRLGIAFGKLSQKKEAITHLRSAYRLARKLGARPLASQASAELERLGATLEDSRRSDAPDRALYGGLTSRQVEILEHIASGLTNKEIAGKLFLSPRTVDMHVSHILERLDCRSRIEAVRKAEEAGLLDQPSS